MAINFELWLVVKIERRVISVDAKAKYIVACALTRQEYNWMFPGKGIGQMYTHFMDIINSLFSLRKKINKGEQVQNILSGILDSRENKNIAFNTEHDIEPKTKDEKDEGEFEEELAMITKRIQRLGTYRSRNRKNKSNNKGSPLESQKTVTVRCYECEEIGRIKSECPKLKKNKKGKTKAMASTWDELDNKFQNEEECLTAREEASTFSSSRYNFDIINEVQK
ncbi:hypothetical protein CDL12_15707 [Handroanthus impetiginosus]|uniref:CCHC-type domain-containing protein n=1 Tax=Handroanthus impetiginosus TaxID=429701 RepID=A0A2G9H2D9_9LAMI|nr:hypothetical protein CDL12_15707 [Handroanthus impetiginosus]